jgi:branched-chain amino acid transport system substrate-binding protein
MIDRRSLLAGAAAVSAFGIPSVRAEDTPGVTATEIKIGSTTSLSGPVSALGVQARCQEAHFPDDQRAGWRRRPADQVHLL